MSIPLRCGLSREGRSRTLPGMYATGTGQDRPRGAYLLRSSLLLLILSAGRLLVLVQPLLIFSVADVNHVHPGVRHLIDGAVAVADPLIRIGVVLVGFRVVVESRDVDDRALRERRR